MPSNREIVTVAFAAWPERLLIAGEQSGGELALLRSAGERRAAAGTWPCCRANGSAP
jgi:hypothetical protein